MYSSIYHSTVLFAMRTIHTLSQEIHSMKTSTVVTLVIALAATLSGCQQAELSAPTSTPTTEAVEATPSVSTSTPTATQTEEATSPSSSDGTGKPIEDTPTKVIHDSVEKFEKQNWGRSDQRRELYKHFPQAGIILRDRLLAGQFGQTEVMLDVVQRAPDDYSGWAFIRTTKQGASEQKAHVKVYLQEGRFVPGAPVTTFMVSMGEGFGKVVYDSQAETPNMSDRVSLTLEKNGTEDTLKACFEECLMTGETNVRYTRTFEELKEFDETVSGALDANLYALTGNREWWKNVQ